MFMLMMDYEEESDYFYENISTSFGANHHYFYSDLIYYPDSIGYTTWNRKMFEEYRNKLNYKQVVV